VERDRRLGIRNDSGGVEYGQRSSETNFNNKFEHDKSVCHSGPNGSASF
jgi:hypothetical protein